MNAEDSVCHACGEPVYDIDVRCKSCGVPLSSTGAQRMIGSTVLDQYEVTDILGQGGMSIVYQGKHKITGQEVALKVLPPELAAHRDVKNRFLEEGRALAQLDHPNIVHLYNFGDDGDCLVLAMQFVRGVTWERLIMDQTRLSWQHTVQLTCDVSNALDYAHGRGIIHRDMKPSNVLIRDLDGAATVMDFGIAKMQSSSKLTATGQTMGTVRYMSPEQVRGKEVDVRTDIYSLAMTTYESLVGDTPFTGDTHFEIMTKHLSERPAPPSAHGIDIPPALEAVLMRAISKNPEDRQSSAREFKEQLEMILSGADVSQIIGLGNSLLAGTGIPTGAAPLVPSAPASASEAVFAPAVAPIRSSRKGIGIAAVALLVAAAGATTFALTQDDPERKTKSNLIAPPLAPAIDAAPSRSSEDVLASAFLLPALNFAAEQSFPEQQLRILSVASRSLDEIRDLVIEARAEYQLLSSAEGWPGDEVLVPLTMVIVPQSALCNPLLYEDGEVDLGCKEQVAWYRPHEHTLYLVVPEQGSMRNLIHYWVAMATCLHSSIADCTDVIERKLGR